MGHPGSITSFAEGVGIEAANRHVMAAHVTIGGETITVDATDLHDAIIRLSGTPTAGQHLDVTIAYESMTLAAFVALPEWQ